MPLTLKEINAIAPELVSVVRMPGGRKFVNEPNGDLDPDKFLDNDEYCWEVSDQRFSFHAKKLIITDWEKESVTSRLKLALLAELMRAGFEVYIWHGTGINKVHYIAGYLLASVEPELEKKVLEHLEQKRKWRAKDIKVLDHITMKKLLKVFSEQHKISSMIDSLEEHTLNAIDLHAWDSNHPTETALMNTANSIRHHKKINLYLRGSFERSLYTGSRIGSLELNYCREQDIKKFPAYFMHRIFVSKNKLERFIVRGSKSFNAFFERFNDFLKFYHNIELENSDFEHVYQYFLKEHPNIRELGVAGEEGKLALKRSKKLALNTVHLSGMCLSFVELQEILVEFGRLTNLNLTNCFFYYGDLFEKKDFSVLLRVTQISLAHSSICDRSLRFFFISFMHLKRVSFFAVEGLEKEVADFWSGLMATHRFLLLETLEFSELSIAAINLQQILIRSQNVKRLNFVKLCIIGCWEADKKFVLAHVEELDLYDATLNCSQLFALLSACFNVKRLDLRAVQICDLDNLKDITITNSPFLKLEELLIDGNCQIPDEFIIAILRGASRLKQLFLKGKNAWFLRNLAKMPVFKEVRELVLDEVVSQEKFPTLLAKLPSLESLVLGELALTTSVILKHQKLKSFRLRASEISEATLSSLLMAFPNLINLELECDVVAGNNASWAIGSVQLKSLRLKLHFSSLLSAFPNLEVLYVDRSYFGLFERRKQQAYSLNNLKQLCLSQITEREREFRLFLGKCQNLKILRLNGSISYFTPYHEKNNGLPFRLRMLEELDLVSALVSIALFQDLLLCSPKLLSFRFCLDREIFHFLQDLFSEKDKVFSSVQHIFYKDEFCIDDLELHDEIENLFRRLFPNAAIENEGFQAEEARCKKIKLKKSHKKSRLISFGWGSSTKGKVNYDTKDNSGSSAARELFIPLNGAKKVSVSDYRLAVFDRVTINDEEIVYSSTNSDMIQLLSLSDFSQSIKPNYRCQPLSLQLSHKWQALPSLTAADKITDLQCNVGFELGYDAARDLYVIRASGKKIVTATFEFFLYAPLQQYNARDKKFSTLKKRAKATFNILKGLNADNAAYEKLRTALTQEKDLAKKVELLVDYFQSFRPWGSQLKGESANEKDKKTLMLEQQKGACRHRAPLFKQLADEHNIPCRIVESDDHVYVEVKLPPEKLWQKLNLGGYIARTKKLKLQKTASTSAQTKPKFKSNSISTTQALVKSFSGETSSGTKPLFNKSGSPFVTWRAPVIDSAATLEEYVEKLLKKIQTLAATERNVVVTAQSVTQIEQIVALLLRRQLTGHFHIDCLADFAKVLKTTRIADNQIKKPPGPLAKYLRTTANPKPLLTVNYARQSVSELQGYKSLVDTHRKLNQQNLPAETTVIHFILPNQVKELSEKFYSRHTLKSHCPDLPDIDPYNAKCVAIDAKRASELKQQGYPEINLYGSVGWRHVLLGKTDLSQQRQIGYLAGELIAALKAPGVVLTNADWAVLEFRQFWLMALNKREIMVNGQVYQLTKDFKVFYYKKPYQFEQSIVKVIPADKALSWDYVLNTKTYSRFFALIQIQAGTPVQPAGWLTLQAGQTMDIFVTESLSEALWSRLLAEAKHCQLNLQLAPNVILPAALCDDSNVNLVVPPSQPLMLDQIKNLPAACITSNNVDAAAQKIFAELQRNKIPANIISINNEVGEADLFYRVKLQDKKFIELPVSIWKMLQAQETVILKGPASVKLAQALTTCFAAKPHVWVNGGREDLSGRVIVVTEDAANLDFAPQQYYFDISDLNKPNQINSIKTVAFANRDLELENFLQDPLTPCCFLIGVSGVGKTTQVENFAKKKGLAFYQGRTHLQEWLENGGIYFEDEANLKSPEAYALFCGIYNSAPGVLYQGKFYKITVRHKMIFAGNDFDFPGRQWHEFFKYLPFFRYDPIPGEVLVREVLDPLFKVLQSINMDKIWYDKICKTILMRFSENNKNLLVEKQPLLTPRTLITDVLLKVVAEKNLLETFLKKFNKTSKKSDFVFTITRQPAAHRITDFLAIRELKQKNPELNGKGLGGVLLEGSSGSGKSTLVTAALTCFGLVEGKDYYQLTAGDFVSMKALLLKAFHEGKIVVIDDINTLSLEEFINDLLTGKDDQGKPAQYPGFMVIATQCSTQQYGSIAASPAFDARFLKTYLPDYSRAELIEITEKKGLPPDIANAMVDDYLHHREFAEKNHKHPKPTPWDLFREAKAWVRQHCGKGKERVDDYSDDPDDLGSVSEQALPVSLQRNAVIARSEATRQSP